MPASGEFHFEPSARLQRFLGRELIADPNLAIAEFVKNGYDAGASQVTVQFELTGAERADQSILIADDGVGMDREAFETNWMRPGFSYKADPSLPAPRRGAKAALERQRARVPIGEKGLGRLAAGRLGRHLQVWTRSSRTMPWLHVVFDWQDFEVMRKAMHDIAIHWDEGTDPPEVATETGTVVQITDLSLNWAGRVPGRKSPGRSDVRLGRLRQDLMLLVEPLGSRADEFEITIAADDRALGPFLGPLRPARPELLDYRYEFSVASIQGQPKVKWRLARSAQMAARVDKPAVTSGTATPSDSDWRIDQPTRLRCGRISGRFFYSPDSLERSKALGLPHGVYLYRDGIRVEPYGGEDDDWLGAKSRKAVRQGHAAIQPNNLTGFVDISKERNPELIDMSNRQGLVENPAYEDFLAHLRAEFGRFEGLIRDEYLGLDWESPQERAQRAADRAERYARAITRAVAHRLRQPVAGLDSELSLLRDIIPDVADDALRVELAESADRAASHLALIDQDVDRLVNLDIEVRFERFAIADGAAEAVTAAGPLIRSTNATVTVEVPPDIAITAPRPVVVEAISELVRNALQANQSAHGGGATVLISAFRSRDTVVVEVEDTAGGLAPEIAERLFSNASTKGRPGAGLLSTRELLALFRGSIELARSTDEGTTFRLTFPTDADVRKEAT